MIRIITIEREFGSGASAIAALLGRRLNWRVLDNSLTDEIAKMAHVSPKAVRQCDERLDSLIYRLGKAFWRGGGERGINFTGEEMFDADRMVQLVGQVIEKASAAGDCIIVGRGAPYFLRDRKDVLSVFLYAPRELKIRRVERMGKSRDEAVDLVDTVDKERAAYVKQYFAKDFPTRTLYHAWLNTAIGDERVAETIINLAKIL
jgi:cytidylate kinase